MELTLEESARDSIKSEVRSRKWSLSECVERLGAVGYSTNIGAIHRFLTEPKRRLGLDEFGAWALALSVPPLALMAPAQGRKKRRVVIVRDWLRGVAPLPEVPDPEAYERHARADRPASVPEVTVELHRQADRYSTARAGERAVIEAEVLRYLANKQLADYAKGQAKARERHGSGIDESLQS